MEIQGSKIAPLRSYLRVPQAAGQVKNFDISSENQFSPYMAIIIVMQGKCLF